MAEVNVINIVWKEFFFHNQATSCCCGCCYGCCIKNMCKVVFKLWLKDLLKSIRSSNNDKNCHAQEALLKNIKKTPSEHIMKSFSCTMSCLHKAISHTKANSLSFGLFGMFFFIYVVFVSCYCCLLKIHVSYLFEN